MEVLIFVLYIYLALYGVFIIWLPFGFLKVKTWRFKGSKPETTFSIVVPFRNESGNLPQLLESLKNLDYPKELFEIILIDDDSDDNSQSIVYKWRMANGEFHATLIENLRISNSPKKDAISRAVPIVVNDWIVTTDADCLLPSTWLTTLNDYIKNHEVSMIAGPVIYKTKFSFLEHFQQMDFISLQGATIGSFGIGKGFMCNGANFAYTKEFFNDLNGFSGNDKISSGDDVFLLQKAISLHPQKVHYLKSRESIVTTQPAKSWRELFYQRVRWASKSISYQSEFGELLALIVFLGNLSLVLLCVFAVFGKLDYRILVGLLVGKFVVDCILLLLTNGFLRKGTFIFPIVSSLFYPFFSVAVALYSFYGNYEWKGRKLR